VLCFIYSKPY